MQALQHADLMCRLTSTLTLWYPKTVPSTRKLLDLLSALFLAFTDSSNALFHPSTTFLGQKAAFRETASVAADNTGEEKHLH
jgi:hypothetical protein